MINPHGIHLAGLSLVKAVHILEQKFHLQLEQKYTLEGRIVHSALQMHQFKRLQFLEQLMTHIALLQRKLTLVDV